MLEMEEKERIITEVMDNFNFERVERVMEALNWCWDIDGVAEVPNISTLKWRAEGLLDDVMTYYGDEKTRVIVSTGGFKATLIGGCKLMLEFVLDESVAE